MMRRQELTATVPYQPGYLSLEDAARYASVSTRTMKRWIKAGLPVYQGTIRGKVLIRPTDVDAYLTRQQVPQLDLNAMVDDVLLDLGTEPKPTSDETRPRAKWARA
jgi:excisionase family DNA binding protein